MLQNQYIEVEAQVSKTIQLYETMTTRHTTMIVGPTRSGKSVIIDLLKQTLTNKSTLV